QQGPQYGYSTITTATGFSTPTVLDLSTTTSLGLGTTTEKSSTTTSLIHINPPRVSSISLPKYSSTPTGNLESLNLTCSDVMQDSAIGDSLSNTSRSPKDSPATQVSISSPVFSFTEPIDLSQTSKENKENKQPSSLLDTPVRKIPKGDQIRCSLKIKQNVPKEKATKGAKLIDKLSIKQHHPDRSSLGNMTSKPISKFTSSSRPKGIPLKESKQGKNGECDDQDSGYSGSPFMWAEDYKGEIHPIMYPGPVYYVPFMPEGQSGHYPPMYYAPDHPYEEHW
ncbi:unnamed protein product, partial [Owenia fusiformis]